MEIKEMKNQLNLFAHRRMRMNLFLIVVIVAESQTSKQYYCCGACTTFIMYANALDGLSKLVWSSKFPSHSLRHLILPPTHSFSSLFSTQ
jgi:hypothetical protein